MCVYIYIYIYIYTYRCTHIYVYVAGPASSTIMRSLEASPAMTRLRPSNITNHTTSNYYYYYYVCNYH